VGKTVMPLRNIRVASGFQPDNLGKTPEERRSLDKLFSVTYEELRRLASSVKRSDPGATLSPTTMVNEAWVKLAKSPGFVSTSQLHFISGRPFHGSSKRANHDDTAQRASQRTFQTCTFQTLPAFRNGLDRYGFFLR
jgi:hypothetical protein